MAAVLGSGWDMAAGAVSKVKASTIGAVEQVMDAAPVSDGTKQQAVHAASFVAERAKVAAAAGMDVALDQRARVERMTAEFKLCIEKWLKQKLQKQLEFGVDKIPSVVKESLEDEDMPRVVSNGKDRAVDGLWPDFKQEIMWEIAVLLDADKEAEAEEDGRGTCICSFFRYHLYPYDKTFWGRIWDPVWVIFTLVSLIPWAGMTPIVFFFIFWVIDKSDEFQLIVFILQFKGTQFLSHGVIRTLTGFFMYLHCVTVPARKDHHTCEDNGPGVVGVFEVVLVGWLLQMILIWSAWILLTKSKERGRSKLKGNVEVATYANASQKGGGYILYLMLYDLVVFVVCCCFLVHVMVSRESYGDWVVRHTFWMLQICYGYSSLPFFFFTLPGLQQVLTHSVRTAYNQDGVCVAFKGPPKPKKERPKYGDLVSMEDAKLLMDKIQGLTSNAVLGLPGSFAAGAAGGKTQAS